MEGYKCKVNKRGIAKFAIDNIEGIIHTLTKDAFAKKKEKLSQEEIKRLHENLAICRKTLLDLIPEV